MSPQGVVLDYGELPLEDDEGSNIVVGGRSIDFFYSPSNFPLTVNGEEINMRRKYTDNIEEMIVEHIRSDREARMNVRRMTDYQKTVAFLYLIAEVMPNAS